MKVLTRKEVLARVPISDSTLTRWINANLFPPSLTGRGRKQLWAESQIEQWIEQQSAPTPVVPAISPIKEQRWEAKEFAARQADAKARLMSHSVGRRSPRKQNNSDAEVTPTSAHKSITRAGKIIMTIILILFLSQSLMIGALRNTAFSTTPKEVTEANATEIFRYDHSPILFEGGHCLGTNFVYATCIPFDIDNSKSDNPADWITSKEISHRLKELGINHLIVASRNHLLPKEGKAPRPKFHVYLRLFEPLYDSGKFVLFCEWCIDTFGADPKVKSKAQKIFGYGDNPNAFVMFWNEGQCVDEVLTDDDLFSNEETKSSVTPSTRSYKKGGNAFDRFAEGEWRNHLPDLEEHGWEFFEGDGVVYFQTPDGDHDPGKQDGNIKDGVAYFFSKVPFPFKENKGYSICDLFAGVLFGDIGKKGRAMFAERYLRNGLGQFQVVHSDTLKNVPPPPKQHAPFPTDALPRFMQDMVRTVAKAHCVPEAFVAYPALVHSAAAIGNRLKVICYPDGGGELSTLWNGILALSGTGKTEVLKKLDAPFIAIEQHYYKEVKRYMREKEAGNDVKAPKKQDLRIDDTTMEATFELCGKARHGLLLSQPEGRLFFSFDAYRTAKTDEPNYCKLYDGTHFKINRKSDTPIEGFGTLCVAMTIQQGNFGAALSKNKGMTTSGLRARMNLCCPAVEDFHLVEQIDNTAYRVWNRMIAKTIGGRDKRRGLTYNLDEDAQKTWNRYMVDCRNLARQTEGWLGGYYDRLHVTAIRIAIQLHYFEGETWIMSQDTIERAIAIAEYMRFENERVVAMFSDVKPVDSDAEKILRIIREHDGEARYQDFREHVGKYHGKGGTELMKAKVSEMVAAGRLLVRVGDNKVLYFSIAPKKSGDEGN